MKAIVMGATSGIGKEVALNLAAKGWEVAIAGRRSEKLQEVGLWLMVASWAISR